MKLLCRAFVMIISSAVLFVQCEKKINPYDPVDIPDQTFLNALIEEGVDRNGDGKISYSEADHIKKLDVCRKGIADLTGIEAFIKLEILNCSNNHIKTLDIGNLSSLIEIRCGYNQLTTLDISNHVSLSVLYCNENQLTSLDISNNIYLEKLHCYLNQLPSLDISHNYWLWRLWCGGNQLTSLDISKHILLNYLECGSNQLLSLDVSNNPNLEDLDCGHNQLTSLDVSNNPYLGTFRCRHNQLTNLDISNNTELTYLWISGMPSLFEICVWEDFNQDSLEQIDVSDSPNVYFTTDCSMKYF